MLTFSNLSYIYRDLDRYHEALKSVNYAISLEEKLAAVNYGSSIKEIITSYLNKSAILSELNQHEKSIQSVEKSLQYIQKFEQQSLSLKEDEKVQIQYLYMVAFFNLANENETEGQIDKAVKYYEESKKFALLVKSEEMQAKITNILDVISKKKKWVAPLPPTHSGQAGSDLCR